MCQPYIKYVLLYITIARQTIFVLYQLSTILVS